MALVQLNCDVVIIPIVQEDPIVLCCGDLRGKGTFSSMPPLTKAAQAGEQTEGTQGWKGVKTILSPLLHLARRPSFREAGLGQQSQAHLSFTADLPAKEWLWPETHWPKNR